MLHTRQTTCLHIFNTRVLYLVSSLVFQLSQKCVMSRLSPLVFSLTAFISLVSQSLSSLSCRLSVSLSLSLSLTLTSSLFYLLHDTSVSPLLSSLVTQGTRAGMHTITVGEFLPPWIGSPATSQPAPGWWRAAAVQAGTRRRPSSGAALPRPPAPSRSPGRHQHPTPSFVLLPPRA